jgi:hypothetical protein
MNQLGFNSELKFFTKKPFNELNEEEIRRMIRNPKAQYRFSTEEMLNFYNVDINVFCEKLKELGITIKMKDRRNWDLFKKENGLRKEKLENITKGVTGIELKAMRMSRGKTLSQMAKLISKYHKEYLNSPTDLENFENDVYDIPPYVTEGYIKALGITRSHIKQFRKILKGQLDTFTEDRTIASHVKNEVRKKCNDKCTKCGSKQKLHFHHIERFADGGQNTVENLTLLCASCHAEEHKGERVYHMLKSNV